MNKTTVIRKRRNERCGRDSTSCLPVVGCLFTRDLRLLVAVVCGAAHGVDACVVLDRRGTDKWTISGDQLLLVNTLATLGGLVAS